MAVAIELAHKQGYKYLISYAPHDPIISFKHINNKVGEHENLGDRTEMFFKSCGFKDVGTYKDETTRGDGLKVYARTANKPLRTNIEHESNFISSNIIKKIQERGEDLKNVITENQVCKQQRSIC